MILGESKSPGCSALHTSQVDSFQNTRDADSVSHIWFQTERRWLLTWRSLTVAVSFLRRTKALVLELLAAVCLVRGGHEIILSAFDNFKEVRYSALLEFGAHVDSSLT